jgi:hypothetical protein
MEQFTVGRAHEDEPELEQPEHAGIVPKVHFRWILSGPSRSGKTNLARFTYDRFYTKNGGKASWFDEVWLLSPTAKIDFQWAGLPGLKDRNRITNPTPELLQRILNDQRRALTQGNETNSKANMKRIGVRRNKAKKILIIFDDAIAESRLINSSAFLKIFIQGRHYNISSMVMTQSYMRVPRSARIQATHLSLFPSKQTEIDRVYKEHGPKEISKTDFIELCNYAVTPTDDSPFPFLYVDVFAKPDDRFRKNYTEKLEISQLADHDTGLLEDEQKQGGTKRLFEEEPSGQKTKRRRR